MAKRKSSTATAIRNKAKKTGVSASKIRAIYNRGLAAYRTSGHRKGVSPQAWAMARVNSALTGGKAAKVDKDTLDSCYGDDSDVLKYNKEFNIYLEEQK